MANITSGKDILSAYRANLNPDIQKKLMKISDINDKYKLTPGTEQDFNSAATFYMYSQVKNSEAIDSSETELSRQMGDVLVDYHKSYVSDSKMVKLLSSINRYNKEIDNLYNRQDAANAIRIMKNVYGIDPSDFSISDGSYAHRALLEIKNNYYNKVLPRLEMCEMIARIREEIRSLYVTNDELASLNRTDLDTVKNFFSTLFTEMKKSTDILSSPKIIYVNNRGSNTFVSLEIYVGSDKDIHELDNTFTIVDGEKLKKLIILVYSGDKIQNPSLTPYAWYLFNPNEVENPTDSTAAFKSSLGADEEWCRGATGVITNMGSLFFTDTQHLTLTDIESSLFGRTTSSLQYDSTDVAIGEEESHYTFSSYEKQFLLFATFFFVYEKIYTTTRNGIIIESVNNPGMFLNDNAEKLNQLITLNADNSETIIELNDGISGLGNTKLISNEWDIHTNILIKLSDTLSTNVNIKTGYLKDPYEYIGGSNTTDTIKRYRYSSNNNAATDVISHISVVDRGIVSQLITSEKIGKENETPGFFVYPEMRKSYAVIDIKNLYFVIKKLYTQQVIDGYDGIISVETPLRLGKVIYAQSDTVSAGTEIFNDLNNTNLFSKLSHNESKLYIYEDKTMSLYTELQNDSYTLKSLLMDNLECESDFDKEYIVTVNSFKIYYEFNEPTTSTLDKSISDIKASEKRYASDVEAYYALNYYNLNYFEFKNILVDTGSVMFDELDELYDAKYPDADDLTKKGFGLKPGSNDKYTTVSFSILYKEFNPVIRDLTLANVQNRLIAEYNNSVSSNILNSKIYDYITDYSKIEKITAIPKDNGYLFANLHTNSYICRYSSVDDIVSYLAGDIINYGVSSQSKDEIQMLLNIYKETRNYFYKVLMNKAFAMDDQYSLFKRVYIKAYAIERFVSSRLTNLTEIKYYTAEDCRNFLISYGLKTLSDQVDSANFADSITYKKRIIANYNNLMSMKGSRAIIDEFFKLFNYDTTEIVLYKYLLYKDGPLTYTHFVSGDEYWQSDDTEIKNFLKFVPVTYDSKNAIFNIKNNSKKAKKYEEFLAKDVYWDENELTPEIINEVFESPVNTKYMGIDLKKDIYMSYIKAKYTMSLIDYLYNQFTTKFNRNYLENIKISIASEGDEASGNDDGFSILDVYNAIRYLFALYISINDAVMKNRNRTNGNVSDKAYNTAKTYVQNHNLKYFYGINPNARISNFQFSKTFLTPDLVEELFSTYFADENTEMFANSAHKMEYYTTGLYRHPAKLKTSMLDSSLTRDLLFGQDAPMPMTNGGYLIPLRLSSTYVPPSSTIFSEEAYEKLACCTGEIFSEDDDVSDLNAVENTALNAIETGFKSINLINLLNSLSDGTKEEKEINEYKFKAAYFYEKFADKVAVYPASLSELGNIDDPESEFRFPEKSNFYTCLFEKVLSFPTKYLDGEFNITRGINYTHDIREILNEIFSEFYTVTDEDVIGYLNNTVANSTTQYTFTNSKFLETVYENNPIMDYLSQTTNILLTKNNNNWTYEISGTVDQTLSDISDRIISLTDILATASEQYQLMKVDLQFGESLNNFFDFIKTCINFFISYTSTLYESSLILKIETENERIPLTYKIFDSVEHTHYDYFYYDESIKVDEIIDQ